MSESSALSIGAAVAFEPSPRAVGGFSVDDQFFEEELKCPMSRRCELEPGEDIVSHLKVAHDCAEHAAQAGVAEITVPLIVDGNPRRQAVLLKYDDRMFFWSFESRTRADAETMASVTVQLLEQTTARVAPSPSRGTGSPGGGVRLSIVPPTASTYKCTVTVSKQASALESGEFDAAAPRWESQLRVAPIQRHEKRISDGQGVVVLYPTHKEFFRARPEKPRLVEVTVLTWLEQL